MKYNVGDVIIWFDGDPGVITSVKVFGNDAKIEVEFFNKQNGNRIPRLFSDDYTHSFDIYGIDSAIIDIYPAKAPYHPKTWSMNA